MSCFSSSLGLTLLLIVILVPFFFSVYPLTIGTVLKKREGGKRQAVSVGLIPRLPPSLGNCMSVKVQFCSLSGILFGNAVCIYTRSA